MPRASLARRSRTALRAPPRQRPPPSASAPQVLADKLQHEKGQLQHALQEENELGFIAGIAEMPKHECDIPEAVLRIPSVNFQARATLNAEPICQLIHNLAFNVQARCDFGHFWSHSDQSLVFYVLISA